MPSNLRLHASPPARAAAACLAGLLLLPGGAFAAASMDLDTALARIRDVGPEGQGNRDATLAWSHLASTSVTNLPRLVAAMDHADPRARNYLFAAVSAAAQRGMDAGGQLPLGALGDFLLDTTHAPLSRQLAYELIARADPAAAEALLPGLLDDPAPPLRREAVQRIAKIAAETLAAGRREAAIVLYQQALAFAREADQLEAIANPLKDLGRPVDLVQQLGFLTRWQVIGPFDNTGNAGFEKAFPPEQEIVLDAEYDGKGGKVRWKEFTSTHPYGMVDFNKACVLAKEVTGYAFTVFDSETQRDAEIRLGSKNGWKLWFNGQYLFGRDEYHRGAEIDQYRFPVQLRAGRNTLLVKVTQNADVEDWTVEWEFQLRITDPSGRVLRSAPPKSNVAVALPLPLSVP